MNIHTKLVSRKQKLNSAFLPVAKSFTEITSASKSEELAGKLTLFQQKLILTYNVSNYIQYKMSSFSSYSTVLLFLLFLIFRLSPALQEHLCSLSTYKYMCVIQK